MMKKTMIMIVISTCTHHLQRQRTPDTKREPRRKTHSDIIIFLVSMMNCISAFSPPSASPEVCGLKAAKEQPFIRIARIPSSFIGDDGDDSQVGRSIE